MDKQLENIHLFLPNLKIFISLNTTRGITDKTLENFAKLKNISTIIMNTGFQNPSPFTQLIKSYPKLVIISLCLKLINFSQKPFV
jgi:hypothetical protein